MLYENIRIKYACIFLFNLVSNKGTERIYHSLSVIAYRCVRSNELLGLNKAHA